MKLVAVLTASMLAFTVVSTHSQTQDLKSPAAFQVKRNVLIKDAMGAKLVDLKIEELKLWEDGTEQEITALTPNSSPLYLEIVLDDSGSMASQRANMTAIAKFIVQSLETGSHVQIVRFGGPERVRVATDWTEDKQRLLQALDDVPTHFGGSPIIDGVWTALDQIKMAKELPGDKRFAVLLISDCMEGGSFRKPKELLDELIKSDVSLFTVSLMEPRLGFDHPRLEEYMRLIEKFPHDWALVTGGSVYFPRKGENARLPVSESLKGLASELQSQFVLTYTPTNQARDGKERNLRLEIAETYDGKRSATIKDTHVVTLLK